MKKIITSFYFLTFLSLLFLTLPLSAQRPMDKLDRSVVAQKVSNGVYVNWRITSDEWYNTSYKLYRDGTFIFETGVTGASNYLDVAGTVGSKYSVSKVKNGVESAQSAQATVLTKNYLEIPMRDIKKLGKQKYYLNDATAADLDGDGQYEVIIKRMRRDWTAECVDFTYFEAYKLDGTFMWAIDVGPNITMDVEIDIAAFDFDGDGKAEVFMRSSDNTVFGLDINNQNGTSVGDRDGDGYTNYRKAPFNGIGGDGFMNAGPEYLSLIDGMTGKELDWVNFIPRGQSSDWGDGYGHRANKFYFGAPFLDGKKPSLFIGRGIYTMTKMQTYDIVNKKLIKRWNWECTSWKNLQQGKYDDSPKNYFGQGYHNYTIADVDGDGKDEINWGSMTIDDDGLPLYSTELGHGDAQHYGDFDPYRKGQEMFACNEDNPGTNMRDAKTGEIIFRHITPSDCGRAGCGNISDDYRGAEIWGGGVAASGTDRVKLPSFRVAESNCIYWDGDILQELCDHSGFATSTGVGYGAITKFKGYDNVVTLLNANAYSCNYTKGTPCLQADIIGDWREEAIWWKSDSLALCVYTTPYETTNRIYTLMHDHQYRQAICWQMCGYNQPPHISYYLGADFPTPIPAISTNGKLVWKGNTANWNTAESNFMSGDDAVGLYTGTSSAVNFTNAKSVLFDARGQNKTVNISTNLSPELLMVSGSDDYSIGGTGALTGAMQLDKLGEGALTLSGNHTYAGVTEVWGGDLWFTGSLSNSDVMVRRHANFGAKATIVKNINTEYNAGVYVGGKNVADTLKLAGDLNLVEGAKLIFDLSDNPSIIEGTKTNNSNFKNDFMKIDGTLKIYKGSVVVVNEIADSLAIGKYLIAKVNAISGDLTTLKINGTGGKSVELEYNASTKDLYLVIKGTRSSAVVKWTGLTSMDWNLAKTANFENDGYADIFISNDSVYFDNSGSKLTVNVVDSLMPAYVTVNSSKNYTFSGAGVLKGTMTLHKSGEGSLTLNTRNAYTGKTIVDGGTLIMQEIPSATNNGGIGVNSTAVEDLVVSDSATLLVSTANQLTDRGLTLAGNAGGVLNVPASLYWNGLITGTKLTKAGSGILYLGSNNPNLNELVLSSGTVKLNSTASVPNGVGKKVTLLGGTLEALNSIGAYLSSNHIIDVPDGASATIVAAPRCEYNGTLVGSGTLNWSCDFIRAYINGNWSNFNGKINILANGANSSYENHFIVNNSNGFPNATINLNSGVLMCYKNGTSDNGTTTIKMGMLMGTGSIYNAGVEVGNGDKNGSFSGVISGSSNVRKVGSGLWIVSGAQTYTGSTVVSAGNMTVTGSLGSGTITVSNEALLNLTGSAAGSAIISAGGSLNLSGTIAGMVSNAGTLKGTGTVTSSTILGNNSFTLPGSTAVGTLTFGANLTMNNSATLAMQVTGGSNNCDKIIVGGTLSCNGVLDVSLSAGLIAEGAIYQIIAANTIEGSFTTLNLPQLSAGIEWDLTELYTAGKIKVIKSTGIYTPDFISGVVQNPTNGLFRIFTNAPVNVLHIQILDLNGKVVYKQSIQNTNQEIEIDLRNQVAGVYLLKIMDETKSSNMLRLIKK